ncbi:phosphoesterase, partial [bacterium]
QLPRTLPEEGTKGEENSPTKRALVGKSDANFRQFDMTYADSDAWKLLNISAAPKQMATYGKNADPSRVSAWKREFDEFVKNGNLPAFSMLRLPRDHTSGTTEGASSPRAMVADNDYAVGQIVETISNSPYWKSSAIVIVEDDAQNGYDHVDAHRSIAFVISPFIERGTHYDRFGNTDSALRTIELLLGLPPMNAYDAGAAPLAVFGSRANNTEPYKAIMPARDIIAEVNTPSAPQARESALILNPLKEESGPDEKLNEILWRSVKGNAPIPQRQHFLFAATEADDDDD